MNSDDKIDNANQGSDIEICGDSSEQSDDDTVQQNVHYKFVQYYILMNLFFRMQLPIGEKHPPPKEAEPVEYFF